MVANDGRSLRQRGARLLLLAWATTCAAACVPAWHPDHPHRFDVTVPPGWTVTRNARWFGNDFFTLANAQARAEITLDVVRGDRTTAALPLDLLAETRALSVGRKLGITSGETHLDQIVLDGHEAWAVTGRRRWQFVTADFSAVVARVGHHVVMLTLQAPVGHLDDAAAGWSVVLDTLRFPHDRIPADAPLFAPEDE
jgi:hypothetical protein